MSLDRTVANFVAHRRGWVWAMTLLLAIGSVLVIVFRGGIASDVLDLLPQRFDSVRTFKVFDREFSQAHELTFALVDEANPEQLDAFTEHFTEMVRREPWAMRVMDRSPIETTEGVQDVQAIAAPLMLNLEPAAFAESVKALEPAAIQARLGKLRAELEAGSPKAEFELEYDPLGIVGPALKPLAGSFGNDQARPLSSPDGTLRLVMVVTNQTDLGAHACQAMMRDVEELKQRVLESWTGEGSAPEMLVTGRTAYVGELSLKMRRDVVSTFGSSLLTVAGIFYLGFGRLRPLISIVHVLLLCCLVSVAVGALIFSELNMITIGLCAILVGLGEDFGMVLYAFYQQARVEGHDHATAIAAALRHHGRAVIFGALTTAVAFLALLFSGVTGFAQLGVLIAVGILFAGALMMTVFFVFLSRDHQPPRIDVVSAGGAWFVEKTLAAPRTIFLCTTALLAGLAIYLCTPAGRLKFEANPKSLEPRDSNAGRATRTIQAKMPNVGEPLFVIIQARDQQQAHAQWSRVDSAWSQLVEEGKLRGVATPAPLAISPERARANATTLHAAQLVSARGALTEALAVEGLSAESFRSTFALLDTLAAVAGGNFDLLDWRKVLPAASPWWFVLEHFFGNDPLVGIAYVTPLTRLESFADKEKIRALLAVPGVETHISGWSYTLADLIPWAKSKGLQLTAAMVGFNVFLLAFLYRRFFPLFILMLSLALSMVAMLATLSLFQVPLNLFNMLAFPLVLGVGVDYGIYVVLAMRAEDPPRELKTIFKPVLLSGLTTVAAFGSLVTAQNPALWSLGVVCASGVAWCLFSTFFFVLPAYAWRGAR